MSEARGRMRTHIGRYRIEREVARGGMGAVYLARSSEGRPVALKLLLAGRDASPLQRRRVGTEVQALLRLRHPHVVGLLDAGEHEGVPYLVMEWVEGETLAARLERDGPLDPRDAVALVSLLAEALEHCHAQGVLHRDLKPDNVLLRAIDGAPLLTDFGLSKDVGGESLSSDLRTVVGRLLGTPGYWSPEQAHGRLEAIGPRSDVYGLGAILHAALTGRAPQAGTTLPELFAALERPPAPLGSARPGVPAWLDEVCLRALALDPAERPASPAELRRALAARPTRSAPPAEHPPRRVPLLALGLLVAGGVGTALLLALRPGRERGPGGPAIPGPAPAALGSAAVDPVTRTMAPGPDPEPQLTASEVDERARDDALARGKSLAEEADDEGALAAYEVAVGLDPRCAEAYFGRGQAREGLDQLEEAISDYGQAIALDPGHDRARSARAAARADLRQFEGAVADLDQVIARSPPVAATYYQRAAARVELGQHQLAIADLDQALALDPAFELAYLSRGHLHARLGNHARAIADYDQVIAADPDDALAHAYRGLARASLGRAAEAIADHERALELEPDAPWAADVRGRLELLRARPPEAGAR